MGVLWAISQPLRLSLLLLLLENHGSTQLINDIITSWQSFNLWWVEIISNLQSLNKSLSKALSLPVLLNINICMKYIWIHLYYSLHKAHTMPPCHPPCDPGCPHGIRDRKAAGIAASPPPSYTSLFYGYSQWTRPTPPSSPPPHPRSERRRGMPLVAIIRDETDMTKVRCTVWTLASFIKLTEMK